VAGKDYYQTLGVGRGASADEVKRAFRTLAHKYHPDKPGGDAEKFKEINAAYQVLGDPEKRKKYDQFGSAAFEGAQGFPGGGAGFGGFDFSGAAGFEDLGEMFGDMFGFGGGRRSRSRRGQDIQIDLDLTFQESVFGAEKDVMLTKSSACERCGGVGAEPGSKTHTCSTCNGSGVQVSVQRTILGSIQRRTACATCEGSGEVPEKTCTTCHGSGVTKSKKTITVDIPSGVEAGNAVRLRGEGEAVKGGESGDLFIRLHVDPDPRFEREGDAIFSRIKIGFSQAALGDTIDIETIDGKVELSIPPGTQSGAEFRLRGKGVPIRGRRGDHIVTVDVVTPTHLSREQRELLQELGLNEE
jgi:molecular chaperone DnaJ